MCVLVIQTGMPFCCQDRTEQQPRTIFSCTDWSFLRPACAEFYEQQNQHRKLTWVYSLGSTMIKGNFEQKPIEMTMSTMQVRGGKGKENSFGGRRGQGGCVWGKRGQGE